MKTTTTTTPKTTTTTTTTTTTHHLFANADQVLFFLDCSSWCSPSGQFFSFEKDANSANFERFF